ncbi:MAG TPA: UDP-N-acetylmuramate dehydrogenase [Mycobacteriales bacterium]|nr:UDP-N-acetylmuramate dehydrogenase [Mycobacteriales bacterium]
MLSRPNAPLAPLTTLRLGGPARTLVTVYDEAEAVTAVQQADDAGEPLLVLGGGSNVVLPDEGFDGTVVRMAVRGLRGRRDGDRVLLDAAAGEDWEAFVATTVADRLVGVEALSGIPGLVGGAPIQNIGAYGQEVAQTITSVRAYDRQARDVVVLTTAECRFSYRHSTFKARPGRYLVLSVQFALAEGELSAPVRYAELARCLGVEVGERAPLAEVREAVLALRRGKGMVLDAADVDTRSAGSFFTNPLLSEADAEALRDRVRARFGDDVRAPEWVEPDGRVKTSAAWLIERAGFGKGAFDGPVGLSSKHTLALVNRGGGTAADLRRVARAVQAGVREAFGVELAAEPVVVGEPL